jgi:H+-transporting ATPase
MLVVISMITGDFLAMPSTTDNVHPSPRPKAWRIDSLTIAGVVIGICDLVFASLSWPSANSNWGSTLTRSGG